MKKKKKIFSKGTMQMKRKFFIKGNEWKVIYQKGLIESTGNQGECHYDTRQIVIDESLRVNEKVLTLRHELFHAALKELHVTESEGISLQHQEIIADGFEEIFTKLFDWRWKLGPKVK